MDRIAKTKFKNIFNELLRIYANTTGIRTEAISSLIGINYTRLVRLQYKQHKDYPNLNELKKIEEFFKIDLTEYYPTQCPKIQEYIMKRLNNGIKLTDMSKILGYYCKHADLMVIESTKFDNLGEKQRKIYHDFMNLVIKS